jgi:hypothetical protein
MENVERDHPFSFTLMCDVHAIRNGLANYVDLSQEIERMLDGKDAVGRHLDYLRDREDGEREVESA